MYHKADKGHLFLYTVRGGALVLHEVGFCSHKGSEGLAFKKGCGVSFESPVGILVVP